MEKKNIKLTEDYDDSVISENDPRALDIIFKNMILNATEYSQKMDKLIFP